MPNPYDLIVIGGGPAGLSAAIHAIRKRLDVLLIARRLGGKTNYRLQLPDLDYHLVLTGNEVVDRFAAELTYLDFMRVKRIAERVEKLKTGFRVCVHGGESPVGRAVIVATGIQPLRLNIPGEQEYWMRGLCYSALTYAQLFIDRRALVVGDSRLALLATLELAQIARQVTLVAPSSGELETPLGQHLRSLKTTTVLEGYTPQQVRGDTFARSLVVAKAGETLDLEADGIFVEVGLKPRSHLVDHLLPCEPEGWIPVNPDNSTAVPGLFAAGDVTQIHTEQVLIAIGEGAKAALSAHEYLLNQWHNRKLPVPPHFCS
jgi:thioredoxin reductase